MSKTVIVSGGALNEEFAGEVIKANDGAYIIGVDKGLEFLYHNKIEPSYIVGDFDSIDDEIMNYYRSETDIPIREYNPIKDATDTEIALRLAITLGSTEIIILGATGGRIDHLWANVQCLSIAAKANVSAYILDERNKIFVIDKPWKLKKEKAYGKYLSVFSLDGEVFEFSLKGTKWPLAHHTLKPYDSLTVSNQYRNDVVEIDFLSGTLAIMETRD